MEVRPIHGQSWKPKSKPDRLPSTYTRKHGVRHLFAAYDIAADKMYARIRKRKTHKQFIDFLRQLRRKYSKDIKLIIILDNLSPHKHHKVIEWISRNNVEFAFTPTRASWLNHIEPQFIALKNAVFLNSNPKNHDEIGLKIRQWFRFRNSKRYRLFVPFNPNSFS